MVPTLLWLHWFFSYPLLTITIIWYLSHIRESKHENKYHVLEFHWTHQAIDWKLIFGRPDILQEEKISKGMPFTLFERTNIIINFSKTAGNYGAFSS